MNYNRIFNKLHSSSHTGSCTCTFRILGACLLVYEYCIIGDQHKNLIILQLSPNVKPAKQNALQFVEILKVRSFKVFIVYNIQCKQIPTFHFILSFQLYVGENSIFSVAVLDQTQNELELVKHYSNLLVTASNRME